MTFDHFQRSSTGDDLPGAGTFVERGLIHLSDAAAADDCWGVERQLCGPVNAEGSGEGCAGVKRDSPTRGNRRVARRVARRTESIWEEVRGGVHKVLEQHEALARHKQGKQGTNKAPTTQILLQNGASYT